MFDSLTIARRLTDAGVDREQADVMADAIRQAAEHGDHVTSEQFKTGLAELRADIYRAMMVQTGVTVALLALILAALRWLG